MSIDDIKFLTGISTLIAGMLLAVSVEIVNDKITKIILKVMSFAVFFFAYYYWTANLFIGG